MDSYSRFIQDAELHINAFNHFIDAEARVFNSFEAEKLPLKAFTGVGLFNRIEEAPSIAGKTFLQLIGDGMCSSSDNEGPIPRPCLSISLFLDLDSIWSFEDQTPPIHGNSRIEVNLIALGKLVFRL